MVPYSPFDKSYLSCRPVFPGKLSGHSCPIFQQIVFADYLDNLSPLTVKPSLRE